MARHRGKEGLRTCESGLNEGVRFPCLLVFGWRKRFVILATLRLSPHLCVVAGFLGVRNSLIRPVRRCLSHSDCAMNTELGVIGRRKTRLLGRSPSDSRLRLLDLMVCATFSKNLLSRYQCGVAAFSGVVFEDKLRLVQLATGDTRILICKRAKQAHRLRKE